MVCRKALMAQTRCYCVIYAWHTYVDDEGCAAKEWIGMVAVPLPLPWRCPDESKWEL